MRKLIAAIGLVALAGCTTSQQQTAATAQISACDLFTASLVTVNSLDDQGKLTLPQKAKVVAAVSLAEPYCGAKATLITNPGNALTDLANSIAALATVTQAAGGGK